MPSEGSSSTVHDQVLSRHGEPSSPERPRVAIGPDRSIPEREAVAAVARAYRGQCLQLAEILDQDPGPPRHDASARDFVVFFYK
jgi:hypothetical protein